jgi:hypothetical protein
MNLEMLPFFIITVGLHQLGAFVIWAILEVSTRNFGFRNRDSSESIEPPYPLRISLLFSISLILPFAIPGYPSPGLLLSRLLCMVVVTGVVSLFYWIRFIRKRNLRELYLAIIGMLTSGAGFYYGLLAGAASPV